MAHKTFDPARPVRTRHGRPARIICTDRKDGSESNASWPIVALVTMDDGWEDMRMYDAQGRCVETVRELDLVNVDNAGESGSRQPRPQGRRST